VDGKADGAGDAACEGGAGVSSMVADALVTVELMADVGEDTTSSLGVDSESEIETESEVETEPEAGATPSVGTELLLSAELQ
jgi:hypothetical protein